jgi:hypothetical protein
VVLTCGRDICEMMGDAMHYVIRLGLAASLGALGGLALCASEGRAQSDATPANYRELIARSVLTFGLDQQHLRTAMIAKPYNKPDGIWGRLTGTTVPVICVSIATRSIFGQESKGYFVFFFENGQPRRWPDSSGVLANECGAFSPFNEVWRSR